MAFGMTPITIPGVSIRPPNSAPGAKTKTTRKKKKQKGSKRKPLKKSSKKIPR